MKLVLLVLCSILIHSDGSPVCESDAREKSLDILCRPKVTGGRNSFPCYKGGAINMTALNDYVPLQTYCLPGQAEQGETIAKLMRLCCIDASCLFPCISAADPAHSRVFDEYPQNIGKILEMVPPERLDTSVIVDQLWMTFTRLHNDPEMSSEWAKDKGAYQLLKYLITIHYRTIFEYVYSDHADELQKERNSSMTTQEFFGTPNL